MGVIYMYIQMMSIDICICHTDMYHTLLLLYVHHVDIYRYGCYIHVCTHDEYMYICHMYKC